MKYLARRLATLALTLWAASLAVFLVLNVLPGSPAEAILGTRATPAAVRELTRQLGLDKPLARQYLDWLHALVTARLGDSYISHLPIGQQLADAFGVTGPLIGLAMVVGAAIAVPLGVAAALLHDRRSGTAIMAAAQAGIAVPNFLVGLVLVLVFSVHLGWLPASGFTAWSDSPWQAAESLVLPAISLGVVEGAVLSRFVRSAVLDVLRSNHVRTARAKGLTRWQALRRHGFRVASLPVLTVFGLEITSLIVGAVIVESVFTLPGLGALLLQAVGDRDLIVVQDVVMLVAVCVLAVNFLVDLSYRLLDPRLAGR